MTLTTAPAQRLSIVLPLRSAAIQAERALASLSPPYQENLRDPIEILVIEEPSGDVLGEERAKNGRSHVRYFETGSVSRTGAIELGLREARAAFVAVFLDGTHIVTPRALETALRALSLDEKALIALPEYRTDEHLVAGADRVDAERVFFERSRWTKYPYDVFDFLRFGPANPNGFLGPMLGAACLIAPRHGFLELGSLDSSLDVPGLTALRLWMYTELARQPHARLVVLGGEAGIRQHYTELDAPSVAEEEATVQSLVASAAAALPGFRAVHREPLMFGTTPGPVLRFVAESAALAEFHCAACRGRGEPPWFEDR